MTMILGIETTAHTFGIGIVENGKILCNVKDSYTTEKGGIIPLDAAKHHKNVAENIYKKSLELSKINIKKIKAIAISNAPGLAPCLREGMLFAKKKARLLNVPLIPVNHCIAHLEIGRITGARDPVLLYASGANTQIIAYASGKYRVFGETLDIGIGNFIDTFARHIGLGFPGGPKIEALAATGNFVELPYTIKGMDVAFSGLLTNLKQKFDSIKSKDFLDSSNLKSKKKSEDNKKFTKENFEKVVKLKFSKKNSENKFSDTLKIRDFEVFDAISFGNVNYSKFSKEDLAFSLQETAFAMLVEAAERAMAHTEKKELVLGGGVGCNKRLQEMCEIMCRERNAKFFVPNNEFLVDNGGMIAYLGEIMWKAGIFTSVKNIQDLDIDPRERTDMVEVKWRK